MRLSLLAGLAGLGTATAACGPTEVLVGDTPGVARVVAGVLGIRADTAPPSGPATATPLGLPGGLAAAPDGRVFFTDRVLRRVGVISPQGELTWLVGRGPDCGAAARGPGPGALTCLGDPVAVLWLPDDGLAISDLTGRRVYRYEPGDGTVRVLLGNGKAELAVDGAVAATAPVDGPYGLALAGNGAILVAERFGSRIVRIDPDGRVRVVAGTGFTGDAGDGGPAALARLRLPEGVAVVGDTVYVADAGNHRLRRVLDDTITAYAGIGAPGFQGDFAAVEDALFRQPSALAVVGDLLFVVDRGNDRIRLIRRGADSITTWGGTGGTVPGGDLLEIGRTALPGPQGVAAFGRTVVVADSGAAVIRRIIR